MPMVADMGGNDRKSLWDENSSWWSEQYTTRYDADYEDVILPFVCDALSGFRKIIDVGGGEGRLSRYLIEQNGSEVVSTDFSLFQLRASEAQDPSPNHVQAELARLPFGGGVFDAAVTCLVLEHVLEFLEAVEEISRVIRSGGRFVLVLNHPAMQTPESGLIFDHVAEPPTKYWRISNYLLESSHFEEVDKEVFLPFEHRPISKYINTLIESGFTIDRLYEPALSERHIEGSPELTSIRFIPRLLIVVCSK
ncbi:MAG: SAM-dependent methyltransferase [Acidimicrobiaceae bacterium]|nr:SAM-dependent methyltransferase [Acidimicrobiaceae bacterium]